MRTFAYIKQVKIAVVMIAFLSLGGCVGMLPKVDVDPAFWSNKDQVIGVAVAKLPVPKTTKAGSQGLLDIAINDANSSDLDKHLASLDIGGIDQTVDKFIEYLNGKNIQAKKIDEKIDLETLPELADTSEESNGKTKFHAARDFRALKEKYNVDKLLLINVGRVGTWRTYYGFIPTSDPVGSSYISGQIINLSNNELEWSQFANQNVPNSEPEWDVPPNFPGLTKATMSAYEQTQQMLLNTFKQ